MELVLAVTALSSKRSLSGPSIDCPHLRHHPPQVAHQTSVRCILYFIHPRSGRSPETASPAPRERLQAHSEVRESAPRTRRTPASLRRTEAKALGAITRIQVGRKSDGAQTPPAHTREGIA